VNLLSCPRSHAEDNILARNLPARPCSGLRRREKIAVPLLVEVIGQAQRFLSLLKALEGSKLIDRRGLLRRLKGGEMLDSGATGGDAGGSVSLTSGPGGWASLKREATAAERELEAALSRFLRVESEEILELDEPADAERRAEADVDARLQALAEVVERMVSCETSDRPPTSRAQIQRLREVLFDQKTKFRSGQSRLIKKREHLRLQNILSHRDAAGSGDEVAQELLMRERGAIDSSTRMTGSMIGQAVEIHSELVNQRNGLSGTTGRLVDLGKRVPGVNLLIQRIQNKRTRNNTIIALVIAFCIILIMYYELAGWGF